MRWWSTELPVKVVLYVKHTHLGSALGTFGKMYIDMFKER